MKEEAIVHLKAKKRISEHIFHITSSWAMQRFLGKYCTWEGYIIDSNTLPIGAEFCFEATVIRTSGLIESNEYWFGEFEMKILHWEQFPNWFDKIKARFKERRY